MKILLVGEYNRTHWNLKKGLETLGHKVLVIGFRDGFKKVDVDIVLKNPFSSIILKKLRIGIYKIFKIDLLAVLVKKQLLSKKAMLSNYDIVQFVNESPFPIERKSQLQILKWFLDWNEKAFLLYQKTILKPGSIVFPNKGVLKRERKIIPLYWWATSAAVCLMAGV